MKLKILFLLNCDSPKYIAKLISLSIYSIYEPYHFNLFQYGLYSAYLGCFIYCFLGTSKDITLGPTAVMSLMTAAFAAAPIEQDPTYAVLLSLICGVVQLLMGVLHLGNIFLYTFIKQSSSKLVIVSILSDSRTLNSLSVTFYDFCEFLFSN